VADLEIDIDVVEHAFAHEPGTIPQRVPGLSLFGTVRRRQQYSPGGWFTRNASHSIETSQIVSLPGRLLTREQLGEALDLFLWMVLK
jgi:hypothetical protein